MITKKYINDKTRLNYRPFPFGKVLLQRKGRFFWKSVAWTFPKTHTSLNNMIKYLLWYERTEIDTDEARVIKYFNEDINPEIK